MHSSRPTKRRATICLELCWVSVADSRLRSMASSIITDLGISLRIRHFTVLSGMPFEFNHHGFEALLANPVKQQPKVAVGSGDPRPPDPVRRTNRALGVRSDPSGFVQHRSRHHGLNFGPHDGVPTARHLPVCGFLKLFLPGLDNATGRSTVPRFSSRFR